MMKREVGNIHFPIWLLGDSNPEQWQATLNTPFDPRHPIRHNIWTAVLDVIQETVFREARLRVETKSLYIRNAVDNPRLRPSRVSIIWEDSAEREVNFFRKLLQTYNPNVLLCFGAFSYEFARRAFERGPKRNYGYWGATRLGDEFKLRVSQFDPFALNALPLLHRSISGGKFIQSHEYFVGETGANYFEYVGVAIAHKLLQHQSTLQIWVP